MSTGSLIFILLTCEGFTFLPYENRNILAFKIGIKKRAIFLLNLNFGSKILTVSNAQTGFFWYVVNIPDASPHVIRTLPFEFDFM